MRDELLGLPVEEHDWVVVGATPKQMLAQGFEQLDADFPVFIHPRTREEYALARTETKTGPGHKGFSVDASADIDLTADLKRRDFRINAIARAKDGSLVDPFDGLADLQARRLRHVSEAFVEDPLRVMRGARFVAKLAHLGFLIADSTLTLMKSMTLSPDFSSLSAERLWSETEKSLLAQSPHGFFQTLYECGVFAAICPQFEQAARASLDMNKPPFAATNLSGLAKPAQRMAVLALRATSTLAETQRRAVIVALYRRFGIPRSYEKLVLLAATLREALPPQLALCHAQECLALLELVDALRRRERFQEVLEVCVAAGDGAGEVEAICERLSRAQQVAQEVDSAELKTQALDGKAFGEALRRLRLGAIAELLDSDS